MIRELVAAAFIASVIAGPTMAAAPSQVVDQASRKTADQIRTEFRITLALEGGEVWPLIREAFPEEYAAFEDEMVAAYQDVSVSGVDIERRAFEFTSALIGAHRPEAAKASEAALVALATSQLNIYKSLQRSHLGACATLGETGNLSAEQGAELGSDPTEAMAAAGPKVMKAILEGKRTPQSRPPASEKEVEQIVLKFMELGGSLEWLQSVCAGKSADIWLTGRCANVVLFQEALLAQPPNLIARFTAGTLAEPGS